MASAKYTIHIPAKDELGQPLRVHHAVHQHLTNLGTETPNINEGHPNHSVSCYAEDIPEWDSTMKQIGAYAGEVANIPHVFVTKEGKNTASWPITNPFYRMGSGAEQSAVDEPNIDTMLLEQPQLEQDLPIGSNPISRDPNPLNLAATQLFL